jgi:hypothetical protein
MARPELVNDELWELMKTLLPDHTPQQTGRPESATAQGLQRSCLCW